MRSRFCVRHYRTSLQLQDTQQRCEASCFWISSQCNPPRDFAGTNGSDSPSHHEADAAFPLVDWSTAIAPGFPNAEDEELRQLANLVIAVSFLRDGGHGVPHSGVTPPELDLA